MKNDPNTLTIEHDALALAQSLVTNLPGRITQPRIQVCAALITAGRPICHQHIHRMLPHINRVSIYRVCDWLALHDLLDVVVGKDGIRRFAWRNQHGDHHRHAHFQCENCGRTECLDEMAIPNAILPQGYQASTVNVVINGTCASCSDEPLAGEGLAHGE